MLPISLIINFRVIKMQVQVSDNKDLPRIFEGLGIHKGEKPYFRRIDKEFGLCYV